MSLFNVIKSRLSILDVVQDYVQMKRAGGYYKGPCPFHNETDASFTVSIDKQIFYCFGCHAGGDVISFIAKAENLSQIEAAHHLIEKYSIDIPNDVKNEIGKTFARSAQKDQFYATCTAVAQWCNQKLEVSTHVKDYLHNRAIDAKEWKKFSIGYFPGGQHALNLFIKDMARQNILFKDLILAGVLAEGQSNIYSPFEERILFPIKDIMGRCCGFGGRIFQPNDQRAKYYNSKESEWFAKGTLLFGLDMAKKDMQNAGHAFLVEGYTDCVAMVQHSYPNTVATLGTACTTDHLKTLSRYIKTLYVLYDGDTAGQNAMLRLTKLCWSANLELKIITLPSKEDPASFLINGGDLKQVVAGACDIFTFFVNSLGEQFWKKSLSEKLELCEKILQVIAHIDNELKQDILLQQAEQIMQIPFQSLKQMLKNFDSNSIDTNSDNTSLPSETNDAFSCIPPIEEKIVALVINSIGTDQPLLVEKELLSYFAPPAQQLLISIEQFMLHDPDQTKNFNTFLDTIQDSATRDWIIHHGFVIDDEAPRIVFEKLLFAFRKKNWKFIIQDIKKQIFEAKQRNNIDELQNLMQSFTQLKQEMKQRGLI